MLFKVSRAWSSEDLYMGDLIKSSLQGKERLFWRREEAEPWDK